MYKYKKMLYCVTVGVLQRPERTLQIPRQSQLLIVWATFTYSQVVISLKIECIQNRGVIQVEKLFVLKGTEAQSIKVILCAQWVHVC